ncbi:MAG: hypothetical protein NZ942_01380 [Candidatus Aenigmarchaeota archaeon]|nr:hypothetical protein [Candidatus Aenigmarchaeota archaeon]
MPDLFTPIIQQLEKLGFFNFFFPWLVTLAIMYAILQKSKILGESALINGIVALSIAFLVFAFPVLSGFSLSLPLSMLFTQTTSILLFFFVGFLLASLFYPNLTQFLLQQFTRRTTLYAMIALGIALFITSGLIGTFWSQAVKPPQPGQTALPQDVTYLTVGIILFVVILIIAGSVARMGGS